MKSLELRLGNHVLKNGIAVYVDIGIFMEIYYSEVNNKESGYFPIPLSEEWLLKFGFEQSGQQQGLWMKDWFMIAPNPIGIYRFETPSDRIGIGFQYVHQLQNLYYSLTGTELTIKEE